MRAVVVAALLLAGCAPVLRSGNEQGGIVGFVGSNSGAAFSVADTHCRQFGKAARPNTVVDPATLLFDCR